MEPEDQNVLASLGLIELEPGRKSRQQPNKFAVAYDAKCTMPYAAVEAWDLWYLTTEIKDPDFEDRVSYGWYDDKGREDFMQDLRDYAATNGIPERSLSKACSYAWDEGHSSGFRDILSMESLIEIFNG